MVDGKQRKLVKVLHQAVEPRSYIVEDEAGRKYKRNRRHLVRRRAQAKHDIIQSGDTALTSDKPSVVGKGARIMHTTYNDENVTVTLVSRGNFHDAEVRVSGNRSDLAKDLESFGLQVVERKKKDKTQKHKDSDLPRVGTVVKTSSPISQKERNEPMASTSWADDIPEDKPNNKNNSNSNDNKRR
ncbi:unnamed protein product, partial [Brenthis ino]